MSSRRHSRRAFLSATAYGVAVPPLLAAVLGAPQAGAADTREEPPPRARRFIGVYAPHGIASELWVPGPGFDLRYEHCSLQPFDDPERYGQSFRERIVVIEGLDLAAGIESGTVGHEGARALLTGSGTRGSNPSIDQYLAIDCRLGSATPRTSLVLAVGAGQADLNSSISYLAGGRPVPKLIDPALAYDALFGDFVFPADDQAAAKLGALRAQRRSSLDFLATQLQSLRRQLPRSELARIDQHLTAQRELERRLRWTALECNIPARPQRPPRVDQAEGAARYFEQITQLHIDLLVLAFACDLTRFATLFLNDLSRTQQLPGLPEDMHFDVAHRYRARSAGTLARPETWLPLALQNRHSYAQVAQLLRRLSERRLLDETLVYVSSDMGDPARHSSRSVPTVLAGGGIRGGRHIDMTGASPAARAHNHLLVSLCQEFGVPVQSFGQARDPAITEGPLLELR